MNPVPTDDLMAWLGPAAADLTPEQIERVAEAARNIAERYPDEDEQTERDAALSATVQYLLGETDLSVAGNELGAARVRATEAYVAALQVAILAHRDGESEASAARRAGIDRMSLRKALGKR